MNEEKILIYAGILLLFAIPFTPFFQSIIGEEGYVDYDSSLTTIAVPNSNLWLQTFEQGESNSFSADEDCVYQTYSDAGVNWIQFNGCFETESSGGSKETNWKTINLYQTHWKSDYWMNSVSSNNVCDAASPCISTNTGFRYCYYEPRCSAVPATKSGTIELRWDDFNTNHYQIFVDGLLEFNDTLVENGSIYFVFAPDSNKASDHYVWNGQIRISNARMKDLFGCDLLANEVITSKIFVGPTIFNIDDLPAFKAFCFDYPAIHVLDGVSGSSKQIYYTLANEEAVIADTDEIWQVFYIGDGDALGVTDYCESNEYYDQNLSICANYTGVWHPYEDPVLVNNTNDVVSSGGGGGGSSRYEVEDYEPVIPSEDEMVQVQSFDVKDSKNLLIGLFVVLILFWILKKGGK